MKKNIKKNIVLLSILSVFSGGLAQQSQADNLGDNLAAAPNIVVIIVDDMGYSDISPFGGEIATPNLQVLADEGIRMNRFYTAPMSAPARAMLMTGNSNQQAGMGAMWWYENTFGADGYELRLTDRVVTMPERFKDAGYATMMSGKWHLGYIEGSKPTDRGFERAFAFMGGGASHFNDVMSLGTIESFHTYYTLNGEKINKNDLPEDFYSADAFASQLNKWIIDTPAQQPLFAYLALTTPHDPLQAPDEWIAKFEGHYNEGYAEVYTARINRLKSLGLLHENAPLPKLLLKDAWDKLSVDEKKYEAKLMQVYAAMIANMDYQIGTVIETLKTTGRYENTIIAFMSDNGANPKITHKYASDPDYWKQFDDSYANLGRKGSFITYGQHWANVSNAPYANFHKATSAQGGINTNFIISGAKISEKGVIKSEPFAIYDIAPTLYELAGIDASIKVNSPVAEQYKNKAVLPMLGLSFADYFKSASGNAPQTSRYKLGNGLAIELHNQAAFIDGHWKLRRLVKAASSAQMAEWELFDLNSDPTETNNVAANNPEILERLIKSYSEYAQQAMVIHGEGKLIPYKGVDPITLIPK
ncbi:arylsulfatase [Gammaproteobacteria bacterium]|nr:arylsulfatase [Gammaproteobacteria bacterium]